MSKVGKWVKKHFKRIVKVVKKVIVPIAMVAAVIWTAGAALAFFAPASALATSAFGQGLLAAKAAIGGAVSSLWTGVTKAVGTATTKVKGFLGFQTAPAGPSLGSGALSQFRGADYAARGFAQGAVKRGGQKAGMSLTNKLLLGSTAANVAGGLMEPSAEEMAEAQAKGRGFQGSFYGTTPSDVGPTGPAPALRVPGQQPAPAPQADLFAGQLQPPSPITPRTGQPQRPRVGVDPMDLFGTAYA